MEEKLLNIKSLTKSFGGKTALKDVSFELDRGRIVGLLGPNGSGKTTLIKLINGLLSPDAGKIYINGSQPGTYTKSLVSYLPDRMYFADWMRVKDLIKMLEDFYSDFSREKALKMLHGLAIEEKDRIKNMSKGTKEKVQLILVMSRRAKLYLLDEPIGGVDPAARDYILKTIVSNYAEDSTVIISTHLISDIEPVLDEVIFLQNGRVVLQSGADDLREREGKSVDGVFREVFRC